ncbi:hypothetical protein E2320_001497 [Naja naja]|nr:hypothetical protein E2320_001497 [Naja naja]
MESHRLERIVKHGGESHTAHETPQKSSGDVMHRTEPRGKKITDFVGRVRLRIRRGSELKGEGREGGREGEGGTEGGKKEGRKWGEKEEGSGRKEEEKKEKRSEKRKGGRTEGRKGRKEEKEGGGERGRKEKRKQKRKEGGRKGWWRFISVTAMATTIGGKGGGSPRLSVCMTFSVPKEDTDGPRCWDQKCLDMRRGRRNLMRC